MATAINILVCCFIILASCEAYKILVVYPMPSKSHVILGDGIVRHLLQFGHEVTYVTVLENKNPSPKLRQVNISDNFQLMPPGNINIKEILMKEVPTNDFSYVVYLMRTVAVKTLENENFQKILNDPNEHFDVVITEWMFVNLMSGLAPLFGCPLIWVSPVEVHSGIIGLIDVAPNPAYTADLLIPHSPPYTFIQRVEKLWRRISEEIQTYLFYDNLEEYEYNRVIVPLIVKRGRQVPPYSEVRFNASLVLGNSHVSTGPAISLPQNYKSIGGYHIEDEIKPLPEDLKRIMESNKNGVIYFSMGSNLQSKHWPEEIKMGLLKMFGGLKQTVLWKFEEDLPNVPKNVHILKWAPQPSILSHPNCLLFVTHGGLLSTTETVYYGVPIIGIPVFGDQFINVKRAVNKGFALEVNLSYKIADDLKLAIEKMINNPGYRQKVKELSFIYHDRILKPGAEMVHWVQHVVRTRGAPHLRSPALLVPLYQRLYLDLAALLVAAVAVLFVLLKSLYPKVCAKKKVDTKKKKK